MSNPLVPNYVPGVGRLVTDRFDFQSHITGTNFRHTASQIDLSPYITIDGYTATNVQSAIATLATIVSPPIISPATPTSQGIIQLFGDLGGSASTVKVTGLQGYPISTSPPSLGQVLTWNGIAWSPSAASNAFSANGDLKGSNTYQQVISLSGLADVVSVYCDIINFFPNLSPTLTQTSSTNASGNNFNISAQSSQLVSGNGGNVVLSGGNAGTNGLRGGVKLQISSTMNTSVPVQAVEVAPGRRVLALLHPGNLTTADMPNNTGDLVMYIRNAATIPSSGIPNNGAILYSYNGQLYITEETGNNFRIGSIPNPSIWGTTGQETYTYRNYLSSTTSTGVNIFTYTLPYNTATKVDVIMIGKAVGSADSLQCNLSMGYVTNSSNNPVSVGSVVITDPRYTISASSWNFPTISTNGIDLQVTTGYSSSVVINWFAVVQLTMSLA